MSVESNMLDRSTASYLEAIVKKKPKKEDPKDIRIRTIIEEQFLQEPWAKEAFARIRSEQTAYLKDVIGHSENEEYVRTKTQDILRNISIELRSEIVEGKEHLARVASGRPILLMTNHLGTYKLAGINPQKDISADIPTYPGYDFMYPYPLYFGATYPVAEALGRQLSYVSDDFPGVFGEIHTKAGFINVPPESQIVGGRTEFLKDQTRTLGERVPNVAVINFPEGGTSGKYNEKGPYDLLDFKTGGYVIAAELGIAVVPVAQFFDPQKGMRLKVFPPLNPTPAGKEEYQRLARSTQESMQEWLTAQEQTAKLS